LGEGLFGPYRKNTTLRSIPPGLKRLGTNRAIVVRKGEVLMTILSISGAQSTAQIILSGSGATGDKTYTLPPPSQILSRQFAAIRVWQGFLESGRFYATNILVTREV
jgi:hypothetical protein